MTLSIQIEGRGLKLPANAALDIEETNPFLQLNDALQGDFSYPIQVPVKGNEKALQHVHRLQTRGKINTYDKVIVTDGSEYASGILKNEQVNANINGSVADYVSLYFLKGTSHFFKDVENKTLADCDYGGAEEIDATLIGLHAYANNIIRNGNSATFKYALFDVYNTQIGETPDWANTYNFCSINIQTDGMPQIYGSRNDPYYTPFPYLNLVIKTCFESFGWQVSGFIFDSPEFKRAVLLQTETIIPGRDFKNGKLFLDLKNFVPKIKISSFLIALKNRMGWWYDFDYVAKKCTIRRINDVFDGSNRIDISRQVEPFFTNKISANKKVYGLIAGGSDAPDKTQWDYRGALATFSTLPPANAGHENEIYFIAGEDAFYICEPHTNFGNDWEWHILTHNDFSYIPPDKTDDITTSCLVPIMRKYPMGEFRPDDGSEKLMPEISIADANGSTDLFYICFHYGLQECKPFNYAPKLFQGFGSESPYSYNGTKLGGLSFDYTFDDPVTGTDIGLVPTYWANFLSKLKNEETIELLCRFTPQQVINFKWDATYLINHTEYIIQKRRRQLPYNGLVALTLVRL